jgi:penicillin-binding protein 2
MIPASEDRTAPLTPQLALRVAIVGSLALAMFAIIFFRLWYLQVLSGDAYARQANSNFVRSIYVQAPRGQILDRNGTVMVDSEPVPSVEVSAPDLPVPVTLANVDHPPAKDLALFGRLATVLGASNGMTRCKVDGKPPPNGPGGYYRMPAIACKVSHAVSDLPYANVTIGQDVSKYVQYYLAEREAEFPGVVVTTAYLRKYPLGDTAAQLFGTIGPINAAEVKAKRYNGVSQQAIIGQSGLEYQYDQYLRGQPGFEHVKVDSQGQFQGYGKPSPFTPGQDLKLSIDLQLQRAGEAALAQSVASNPPSPGGAFVAMDPRNGQILAMGSYPTFNPSIFTKPISKSAYAALNNPASHYPLLNRAIQSAGPTGSTFKVITATAALQSGTWLTSETFDDTGQFCLGAGFCLHNAGHAVFGVVDMTRAIQVSSDDFFYNLGAKLNANPATHPNGGPLQEWARRYGIGQKTGVDLPNEVSGALPSPDELKALYRQEVMCENATGPYRGHPKHPASAGGCGIASTPDWTIGYNVNTAVGQGDVQVTPLQLANVYSTLENGGTVFRPHVGLDIQDANGTVLQRIDPPPKRHIDINPIYRQTILDGLRLAAGSPGGTSYDVMGNFPLPVYAKTGTAQYNGQQDYAWYACFVPSWVTGRPIVIVVTVEQGSFGDIAAAPVARVMLNQWFFGKRGAYKAGTSATL